MEMYNVCRLCLAIDDLVYIFNEDNIKLKIRDVISITTGIEIHTKDIISQKICGRCYQFIIQILQFRSQCLKADKYLKDLCVDYLVDKKCYIPNTEVSIKSIVKQEETPQIKSVLTKMPSIDEIHPSIVKLSSIYPEIILPGICLTLDVTPIVQMEINQVENYFKTLNLDFNLHVKKTLSSAKKSQKPTNSSKMQDFCEQNSVITTSKEVNITKISEINKSAEESRSSEIDIKTRNDMKDICDTPSKIPRRKYKSLQSNPKRKSIENSAHCQTDTGNVTPSRKRKLVIESPKEGERHTYCNPTTRRRKLLLTENASKNATNKKLCAVKEKPVEEQLQPTNRTDLESRSSNEHSEVSAGRTDNCSYESYEYESLTSVGKSKPLFVCEICNAVHYNMYELKKHQNKHMRCQFCKAHFRSLESKKLHIENVCLIRKMMNDLPNVALPRIECDGMIRRQYSKAFDGFSALEQVKRVSFMEIERVSNNSPVEEMCFRGFPPEELNIVPNKTVMFPPKTDKRQPPIVPNITSNVFSVVSLKAGKNKLLRSLLCMLPSTLREVDTQMDLPTNNDISIESDTAVLNGLLPHISMYNIPVNVKSGAFKVAYDYTLRSNSIKKMCLWNDLTPITVISGSEGCGSSKAIIEAPVELK